MPDSSDANLQLKKRARRRLVGACALAGLAAIVLPMVMDDEPKQQVQDIELRIPGQDQAPFANRLDRPVAANVPGDVPAKPERVQAPVPPVKVAEAPTVKPVDKPAEKPVDRSTEKPAEKKADKKTEKPEKPAEKPSDKGVKPAEKAEKAEKEKAEKAEKEKKEKSAKAASDEQRVVALLGGKTDEPSKPAASGNAPCVILIGAFANQANVKQLQTKIGELGIKVYTEPLDSPQGKKTRVRAGPFPSREAAEKALDKMKRIGVSGVIAAKP